ncbi:MAG: sugar phosphate nucleotidyltransferase [Methanocellales archaeon]|nr:sugar phosphate nucleotidyltransferase [Methanocellales archaeon]
MTSTSDEMQVVVLCGGRGLRLRPITDEIPKPLVYVKGKPLIHHILDYYHHLGYKNYILCIGYKGELIKEYFDNHKKDWKIQYIDSGDANIIQRIYDTKDVVSDRFIVSYGDTIANVDIEDLLAFHDSNDGLVTITTYRMQSPFGLVFSDDDGLINSFKEKPYLDYWINIGYMVFEREALDIISERDDLISFFNKLISKNMLYSYRHTGTHLTINTEKEKEQAEDNIDEFYTYLEGV